MNAVYLDLAALFELILALFWYDMISICIFKCGKSSHLTNVVHICQEIKKNLFCSISYPNADGLKLRLLRDSLEVSFLQSQPR